MTRWFKKSCTQCQHTFVTRRDSQQFCSRHCARQSKVSTQDMSTYSYPVCESPALTVEKPRFKNAGICERCGVEFGKTSRRTKFCSWRCYTNGRDARDNQRPARIKQPQGFGSQQDRELVMGVIDPSTGADSVDLLCAFVQLLRVSGFEIRKTEKEAKE